MKSVAFNAERMNTDAPQVIIYVIAPDFADWSLLAYLFEFRKLSS